MSKTCTIVVWNQQMWELDQPMLEKALQVAARYVQTSVKIDIYPQLRSDPNEPAYKRPGFLEWMVVVTGNDSSKLTIGVIQRTIGSEFETHT